MQVPRPREAMMLVSDPTALKSWLWILPAIKVVIEIWQCDRLKEYPGWTSSCKGGNCIPGKFFYCSQLFPSYLVFLPFHTWSETLARESAFPRQGFCFPSSYAIAQSHNFSLSPISHASGQTQIINGNNSECRHLLSVYYMPGTLQAFSHLTLTTLWYSSHYCPHF